MKFYIGPSAIPSNKAYTQPARQIETKLLQRYLDVSNVVAGGSRGHAKISGGELPVVEKSRKLNHLTVSKLLFHPPP